MKRIVTITAAFVLGGVFCSNVRAQENIPAQGKEWSLGDCIEYALERNVEICRQEVNVENKGISLQTSQLSRLPSLGANLSETYNIGRTQNRTGVYEDHGSAITSVGANISVPVFQGFRINNQIKSDRLSLEAARQDLEQARQDLSLTITGYYLQVLYALEEEELSRRQISINEDLVERTRKLVNGGKLTQSELYDAESALAQSASRLVDSGNNVSNALLELAQSMNHPNFLQIDIAFPDVDTMVDHELLMLSPIDSIYNDYIERRPSVMAANKRVEQALSEVKIAQSAYWPSINLGASYGTGYYSDQKIAGGEGTFWNQLGKNGTTAVGASMTIPIFNKMGTRNGVRLAKNNVRVQQLALEQAKQRAYKEVQQAYVNAAGAFAKYQAEEKSVEAARKAFDFEQKKFDSGRSTAYQFNEVRQKLESAQAQLSQAKYNFLLRAKILDFYKGEPLY